MSIQDEHLSKDPNTPGILIRRLNSGNSEKACFPSPGDTCVIRFDCYTLSGCTPRKRSWVDGNRGAAISALEFVVGKKDVLLGLEIGVQKMACGDRSEIVIPHAYAYGIPGHPPRIPPKTDLVMVVDLIRVVPSQPVTRNFLEGILLMLVLVGIPTVILVRYDDWIAESLLALRRATTVHV